MPVSWVTITQAALPRWTSTFSLYHRNDNDHGSVVTAVILWSRSWKKGVASPPTAPTSPRPLERRNIALIATNIFLIFCCSALLAMVRHYSASSWHLTWTKTWPGHVTDLLRWLTARVPGQVKSHIADTFEVYMKYMQLYWNMQSVAMCENPKHLDAACVLV